MKYGELNLGQIEAIVNKLGGMEGAMRFLRGELVVNATKKVFQIWKTISVGGTDVKALLKQLKNNNCFVSDWAQDIMGKPAFKTSKDSHEVSFVKVQVKDLGFTEMPTTVELFDCDRLAKYGLDLCDPEDAPHIRLADQEQPKGTWYWIAMEPISDSDGRPRVFAVERRGDGGRWLHAYYTSPGDRWPLVSTIVFRFRR